MMTLKCAQAALLVVLTSTASAAQGVPVSDAVKNRDERAVQQLLRQRADVNAPEADGTTALHWAVRSGQTGIVDALIRAGARVSARNRYGITPLSLAAERGDPVIVERLLKAGADAKTELTERQTVLSLGPAAAA